MLKQMNKKESHIMILDYLEELRNFKINAEVKSVTSIGRQKFYKVELWKNGLFTKLFLTTENDVEGFKEYPNDIRQENKRILDYVKKFNTHSINNKN